MVKILLIRGLESIQPLEFIDFKLLNEHYFHALIKTAINFHCLTEDLDYFCERYSFKAIQPIDIQELLDNLYLFDIILEETMIVHKKVSVFLPANKRLL